MSDSRLDSEVKSGLLLGPMVLFPLLGVLFLCIQWLAVFSITSSRQAAAVDSAQISTRELADTYEAQLIRSLRDITQAMALVELLVGSDDTQALLQRLSERGMLPPALFFTISLLDNDGMVLATTHNNPLAQGALRALSEAAGSGEGLHVGNARYDDSSSQWWIDFARRVDLSDTGNVVTTIVVSVDAELFVSVYEEGRLGHHGILAVIGQDEGVRIARSGTTVFYDETAPVSLLLQSLDNDPDQVRVFVYPHDGLPRYTAAREIFGFPLVMVLGLSAPEQYAAAVAANRATVWQNAVFSLVLLLFLALLARQSRQLQRSREAVLQEKLAHARDVEFQAFHDGLTRLPNRSLFGQLLQQAMAESRRDRSGLAVMFLDLDRFKLINDTLGHDAGDLLLIEVANRVRGLLRDSDVVARLGGDEFIVMLREVDTREQVAPVAAKVLEAVNRPYQLSGVEREISVSIGICFYPRDGADEQSLIKHADTAMYCVKQGGRAGYRFYDQGMELVTPAR